MLVVVMVHHHGNIHAWIHHDRDTGTLLTMSTIVGGYRTHVIRQVTWSSTTVVAHGMIDTVNTIRTGEILQDTTTVAIARYLVRYVLQST